MTNSGQFSLLESLPTEVLLPILGSAESTIDLLSLVCASRRLHDVFELSKEAVLLSVLTRSLGPVLQDLIAATVIVPGKVHFPMPKFFEDAERIIHEYEQLLHGDLSSAYENSLPTKKDVYALVRTYRSVQFLIDDFAASRLSDLRQIHPAAAGPFSLYERRRFAQALLRHHVLEPLVRAHQTNNPWEPSRIAVVRNFSALFRPWEVHQLSDANAFVASMVSRAVPPGRAMPDDYPPLQQTPSAREKEAVRSSLDLLSRKLRDPVLADESRRRVRQSGSKYVVFGGQCAFLNAGPLPAPGGSDFVLPEDRGQRDELYRREDGLPPLAYPANDANVEYPPFAWVDAHDGLDCQRWGRHLLREILPAGQEDTTPRQRVWAREQLARWRWLGFFFWDRSRVELLKTRLPEYHTGWLAGPLPPDGSCVIEADTPRVSRRSVRGQRSK